MPSLIRDTIQDWATDGWDRSTICITPHRSTRPVPRERQLARHHRTSRRLRCLFPALRSMGKGEAGAFRSTNRRQPKLRFN